MYSVENYLYAFKVNLDKYSDLLIENLNTIFTKKFSPNVDLLDFIAFMEPTRFELSITMFSMDKEANEVFYEGKDTTVFAGSIEVLSEAEYFLINETQLNDFFDFYEQNEEMIIPREREVLINWFYQCWEKAGGAFLNLPAFFTYHDYFQSFDLKSKQWLNDDEKWS